MKASIKYVNFSEEDMARVTQKEFDRQGLNLFEKKLMTGPVGEKILIESLPRLLLREHILSQKNGTLIWTLLERFLGDSEEKLNLYLAQKALTEEFDFDRITRIQFFNWMVNRFIDFINEHFES